MGGQNAIELLLHVGREGYGVFVTKDLPMLDSILKKSLQTRQYCGHMQSASDCRSTEKCSELNCKRPHGLFTALSSKSDYHP